MRPRLVQLSSKPDERRHRRRRTSSEPSASTPRRSHVGGGGSCDPAVARVREAGGPVDEAAYSCECGYLFSAAVSTTVCCPHCGAGQAW
jgi:hypothetical protein